MSNSRIAKNTILLYIRMGATMIIGIYSSRIVLRELGIEDYGLYNVVGGVIGLFAFINSALTSGTQRFLNFYSESENQHKLREVFSASFFNHIFVAAIVLIFAESIGLWIVNNKLNVPEESKIAVQWVYQFSVLTSMLLVTQAPYNAVIISNEKMGVYAYISILEVSLKLIIVFLLPVLPYNKLIVYAFMVFMVQLIINLILRLYCNKKFQESRIRIYKGLKTNLELFRFSMWAFLGGAGYALSFQGIDLLLNIFFGPSMNAARGIAFTVNNITNQFMRSFQVAVNPQLVKNYAANRLDEMINLLLNNIKYSLFLVWLIILPVLLETEFLFELWLTNPPNLAVDFTKIILLKNLILCFELPFNTVNGATGNNKNFNIVLTIGLGLTFPLSYFFLKLGFDATVVFLIDLIVYTLIVLMKRRILYNQVHLKSNDLLKKVILPFLYIFILSFLPVYYIRMTLESGYVRLFLVCSISITFVLTSVYFIGFDNSTRLFVKNKFLEVVNISFKK